MNSSKTFVTNVEELGISALSVHFSPTGGRGRAYRPTFPEPKTLFVGIARSKEHNCFFQVTIGGTLPREAHNIIMRGDGFGHGYPNLIRSDTQAHRPGGGCKHSRPGGTMYEGWALLQTQISNDKKSYLGVQSPKKNAKAGEGSITQGRRKKCCFDGMSMREQWSAVENAIFAEDDLQDVPVLEEDNIWDYLNGIAEDESQERRGRQEGVMGWLTRVLEPTADPWFCGRDLNEFLWEFEKSGGMEDLHTRPRYL
ncbi:hypothetical protein ACFX11_012192 [Malus domestica]